MYRGWVALMNVMGNVPICAWLHSFFLVDKSRSIPIKMGGWIAGKAKKTDYIDNRNNVSGKDYKLHCRETVLFVRSFSFYTVITVSWFLTFNDLYTKNIRLILHNIFIAYITRSYVRLSSIPWVPKWILLLLNAMCILKILRTTNRATRSYNIG